jgi:hypothetical protein
MKRSLPFVKRQHFEPAAQRERQKSGSNHHRYGEVKTRLTIGRSSLIPGAIAKEKGLQLALEPFGAEQSAGFTSGWKLP